MVNVGTKMVWEKGSTVVDGMMTDHDRHGMRSARKESRAHERNDVVKKDARPSMDEAV